MSIMICRWYQPKEVHQETLGEGKRMDQWLKQLSSQGNDGAQILRAHINVRWAWKPACNSSLGGWRQRRPTACWLIQLDKSVSPGID